MTNDQEQITSLQKNELTDYNILKTIESDSTISQRGLSSQMEINVASVNFALKRLIKRGFIRMVGINPRRIQYYITPEGLREKKQLAYKFFGRNIPYYKEVRNDIEAKILQATKGKGARIAMYGANELSEIAYMVVLKMNCNFLGFFLEGSKITDEKILDFNIQELNTLMGERHCLLIITETFPADMINYLETNNDVETLNLMDYITVI